MDKNSCYRTLSLRDDATAEQIEKAYTLRLERLKSADYADDPEYVKRKINETKTAYKMLTGREAPTVSVTTGVSNARESLKGKLSDFAEDVSKKTSSKAYNKRNDDSDRKSERFSRDKETREYEKSLEKRRENRKSAISERSSTGSESKSDKRKVPKLTRSFDPSERLYGGSVKKDEKRFKFDGSTIVSVITIGIALISMLVGSFGSNSDTYYDSEQSVSVGEYTASESQAVMDRQYNRAVEYDFESFLKEPENDYSDSIEWDISDQDYCHLYFRGEQLATALGSTDFLGFMTYMTGEEDPFLAYDDQDLIDMVANLINPPEFSDVAGKVSTFTDEVILTYDDYYGFLVDVANAQTDEICDELVF